MDGVDYKVTEQGFQILLKGEMYKSIGLKVKSGQTTKEFLKLLKQFVFDLEQLEK